MADLIDVDFTFRSATFRIRGAKYFYEDEDILPNIGGALPGEDDDSLVVDEPRLWMRILVPLTAVLTRDNVVADAVQANNKRYYHFFCNPDFVGRAMVDLQNKFITDNLLLGNWKISKVMVPLDRCYKAH